MDISKTYRMQQQYYSGFSFLPIESVKKHNYFVYKLYAGDGQMYPLFDSVLNKEVLDTYYIVSIRKAVTSSSQSITQAVANDLEYARDAVALFFRETGEDHLDLVFVERNLRILVRTLDNVKEIQHKLTGDLQNLLSGHDFTSLYKANSDDIANIIDVLKQVCKGMERCITRLKDFTTQLPVNGKHRQPAMMAKYCVNNLSEGLQKWCHVQQSIIYQLHGWRAVRELHEMQEILN